MDWLLGLLEDLPFERIEVVIVVAFPVVLAHSRVLSSKGAFRGRLLWWVLVGNNGLAPFLQKVDNHGPCNGCCDQDDQKSFEKSTLIVVELGYRQELQFLEL